MSPGLVGHCGSGTHLCRRALARMGCILLDWGLGFPALACPDVMMLDEIHGHYGMGIHRYADYNVLPRAFPHPWKGGENRRKFHGVSPIGNSKRNYRDYAQSIHHEKKMKEHFPDLEFGGLRFLGHFSLLADHFHENFVQELYREHWKMMREG